MIRIFFLSVFLLSASLEATSWFHTVVDIRENYIELENGTLWQLDRRALDEEFDWAEGDLLLFTVSQKHKSDFPFSFSKRVGETWQQLPVAFRGPELCDGAQVVEVSGRVVQLSDGSVWEVPWSLFNNSPFKTWRLGDVVMIGAASDNSSAWYPENHEPFSLLFNITEGTLVEADLSEH